MEKFLDELILSERKKRKEKVLDKQIDLERDLPEQYLQTVVMSDKATSIKIPAFMKDLPEKLVEQKYEFEPIPQIIKSTQNGNIPIMRQEESYIISCFMQRQSRHLWGV